MPGRFLMLTIQPMSTRSLVGSLLGCVLLSSLMVAGCEERVGQRLTSSQRAAIAEANRAFITQDGPTRWNATEMPSTVPPSCGPTSLVIACSYLGISSPPGPQGATAAILRAREAAPLPSGHRYTPGRVLARALPANATSDSVAANLDAIGQEIGAGHAVLVRGAPRDAWGRRLDDAGDYLYSFRGGRNFGHWVAVLGSVDGDYLVADPASTRGTMMVSREQLQTFISGGREIEQSEALAIARR
jgi:hypothetical protein